MEFKKAEERNMRADTNKLLKIGEFAKVANVSIRTLRFYDKKNLMKPSGYSSSGYRLYNFEDLLKLEQIIALKFFGLSLAEIKEIIEDDKIDLTKALKIQKEAIDQKIEYYKLLKKAINKAEKSIQNSDKIDWQKIINIIEVVKMDKTSKWVKQFYTSEQLNKIKRHEYTQEQATEDAEKWNNLIADVRVNMDKDPSSQIVQELADRWTDLINQFTMGDESIMGSLKNVYANVGSAPSEFKDFNQKNADVYKFMNILLEKRKGK